MSLEFCLLINVMFVVSKLWVGLGNFVTAKINSPNMRSFQGIIWKTGLESDRG